MRQAGLIPVLDVSEHIEKFPIVPKFNVIKQSLGIIAATIGGDRNISSTRLKNRPLERSHFVAIRRSCSFDPDFNRYVWISIKSRSAVAFEYGCLSAASINDGHQKCLYSNLRDFYRWRWNAPNLNPRALRRYQSTFADLGLLANRDPLKRCENRIDNANEQQSLLNANRSQPAEDEGFILGAFLFTLSFGLCLYGAQCFGLGIYSAQGFEQRSLIRFKDGKRQYLGLWLLLLSGLGLYCGGSLMFFGRFF